MFQRLLHFSALIALLMLLSGCAAAVIGGAAAGGYAISQSDRSTGSAARDARITSTINSLYVRDPGVNAMDIRVDTQRGTVILYGSVASESMAQRAITLARGVDGVHNVVSRLAVAPK